MDPTADMAADTQLGAADLAEGGSQAATHTPQGSREPAGATSVVITVDTHPADIHTTGVMAAAMVTTAGGMVITVAMVTMAVITEAVGATLMAVGMEAGGWVLDSVGTILGITGAATTPILAITTTGTTRILIMGIIHTPMVLTVTMVEAWSVIIAGAPMGTVMHGDLTCHLEWRSALANGTTSVATSVRSIS